MNIKDFIKGFDTVQSRASRNIAIARDVRAFKPKPSVVAGAIEAPDISCQSSSEVDTPVTVFNTEQQKNNILSTLSPNELVEFEERAAIMEYDGGLSRTEAEKRAL